MIGSGGLATLNVPSALGATEGPGGERRRPEQLRRGPPKGQGGGRRSWVTPTRPQGSAGRRRRGRHTGGQVATNRGRLRPPDWRENGGATVGWVAAVGGLGT
jgi:hypothetical protein